MASEVQQSTRAINDPPIEDYVTRLGHRVADAMPDARVPFTINVISDDPCPTTHEPASLPGGYIFVPAALFLEAHSEAEFAGNLAHSMAHVAARHGTRQASRVQSADLGTIPLIFIGGWSGNCPEGSVLRVGFRAANRNYELEADSLAIAILARARLRSGGIRELRPKGAGRNNTIRSTLVWANSR